MSTWFKLGVFGDLTREAAEGFRKIDKLYARAKKELYVTSVRESTHGPGTRHHMGDAWDQRKNGVSKAKCKRALGKDFDVIDEHNHRHIEYDPKAKRK